MKFEYDKLYDKRGNERENYIIERYARGKDYNWYKDSEYTTHNTDTFVINNKIYYKVGDKLLLANMKKDTAFKFYERIKCKDTNYKKQIRSRQMIDTTSDKEMYQNFKLRCEEYSNGEKHYYSYENINNYETKYKDDSLDTLILRIKGEIRAVKAYLETVTDEYIKRCQRERESFLKGILNQVEQLTKRVGVI